MLKSKKKILHIFLVVSTFMTTCLHIAKNISNVSLTKINISRVNALCIIVDYPLII